MGVSSCTGPIMEEELQTVMLGGKWEMWGSSLAPVPSQCSLNWCPWVRHLVCEEYKHSVSVQSLLITL